MLFLGNTDVDYMLEQQALLEEAGLSNNKLTMEILDIDKFVKVNDLKVIDDPVFFNGPTPSPRGLLSNEIFGITKADLEYMLISILEELLFILLFIKHCVV